jgi:hypothetical protein
MPAWKEKRSDLQKDPELKTIKTNLFLRLRGRNRRQEKKMRKDIKKTTIVD